MTNIDFTNEESVNYILNYSQMLINEMAKTKTKKLAFQTLFKIYQKKWIT